MDFSEGTHSCMFIKLKITLFFILLTRILIAQDSITVHLSHTYGLDEETVFSLEKIEKGNFPSIRGNEFTIGGKKYSIAITDFNRNNIFGDIPDDYIHLVPFSRRLVPQFPQISDNVIDFKESLFVNLDGHFFKLTVLNKSTPTVILNKLPPDAYDSMSIDISCQSGIPAYELKDIITGENYDLEKLKKGYVVFYFWGVWCEGCLQVTDKMKQLMAERNDVQFVFFNWEDTKEKAVEYIKKKNILSANHYLATEAMKKDFSVNAFPTFSVYHDNKYLAKFNFMDSLLDFFKKH